MLRKVFGVPVHLENDANVAAVAEHKRGAGQGVRNLAYVTWSTGIGSGLVLDGHLYSGTHGSAGELGHMVLDPNGPPCFCGMRGCVEAYASGHSIATRAGVMAPAVTCVEEREGGSTAFADGSTDQMFEALAFASLVMFLRRLLDADQRHERQRGADGEVHEGSGIRD